MPKLTETTNDKKEVKSANQGNGPLVIEAAHEPLPGGTWTGGVNSGMFSQYSPLQQFMQPTVAALPSAAPAAEVKPLKVAVIGTAPSSRLLAPFADPSWTIWACSPGNMNTIPRFDAWFEIHGNLLWPANKHYGEGYIEWLKKQTCPIYMQEAQMYGIPNAVAFPVKAMVKEFGGDFFTSSFSWMMAMAINMGATEIALYGVDMASREEYILQRPGFYFFRYMAKVKGIKVFAPNESDIMQPPGLYGYSDTLPFARKLHARREEVRGRIAQMEQEKARLVENILYLKGADEDIDYTLSIWSGVQDNSTET
jgi:hypothetical protein